MSLKTKTLFLQLLCIVCVTIYFLFSGGRLITGDVVEGNWFYATVARGIGENRGLVLFWILFVIASLLPVVLMRSKEQKPYWRAHGVYAAFIISLFTEMFGAAFVTYLLSPLLHYPLLTPNYLLYPFPPIIHMVAWYIIFLGLGIVIVGWWQIYSARKLVTTGLYKYIRHPQYLGIILISVGWVLAWPTVFTVVLLPVIVFTYWQQARLEDEHMRLLFKEEVESYRKKTGLLLPKVPFLR